MSPVVAVTAFDRDSMILATAQGEVKRTPLSQFESVRRSGLIAMDLPDGDELIAAGAARPASKNHRGANVRTVIVRPGRRADSARMSSRLRDAWPKPCPDT